MGINEWTYMNWEKGRAQPNIKFMPRVIGYLGYDLLGRGVTFGRRLLHARLRLGLTQAELGTHFGLGRSTIGDWEREASIPQRDHLETAATIVLSGNSRVCRASSRRTAP